MSIRKTVAEKLLHLRDNKIFEWSVITIIILSSITIGVRTYALPDGVVVFVETLDWLVTLFFLIELLIRIGAEEKWWRFFTKGWNIFDFIIVVASLVPLDNNEYALLGRLLRLFRVMRLISFIPQLRVLTSALVIALPRMSYVALLMFVIFYMYAVVGSLLFNEINPVLWGDVGRSLLTLFRVSTFEDWTDVMYETMELYPLSWIYYLTFIFLSAFVFLNMMIGVIINVLEEEHQKVYAQEKPVDEADIQAIEQQLNRIETSLERLTSEANKKG